MGISIHKFYRVSAYNVSSIYMYKDMIYQPIDDESLTAHADGDGLVCLSDIMCIILSDIVDWYVITDAHFRYESVSVSSNYITFVLNETNMVISYNSPLKFIEHLSINYSEYVSIDKCVVKCNISMPLKYRKRV